MDTSDQVRMALFTPVDAATIDGMNNDGSDLGGTDYMHPTAPGLELWVTTAASQAETESGFRCLAAPVGVALGGVEDAPEPSMARRCT